MRYHVVPPGAVIEVTEIDDLTFSVMNSNGTGRVWKVMDARWMFSSTGFYLVVTCKTIDLLTELSFSKAIWFPSVVSRVSRTTLPALIW